MKVFIGIGDSPIVFVFELIDTGLRVRISSVPELLDEAFLLLRGGQAFKDFLLLVGDDIDGVFSQPLFEVIGFFLVAALKPRQALKEEEGHSETDPATSGGPMSRLKNFPNHIIDVMNDRFIASRVP